MIGDARPPEERAFVEQFSAESDLQRALRRAREYFGIIERIESERDELWSMYRVEVSEHLNAQALMERRLMENRAQLGRSLKMLNEMRKEKNMPLVKKPTDLEPYEGEPIGVARDYADNMVKLCDLFPERLEAARPKMVDGSAEREEVAGAADNDRASPAA